MTTPKPGETAALHAAYTALLPYTQVAQIRAVIAEHIVDTLLNYHPYAAVDVAWSNWPEGIVRLNKAVLADVIQAAYVPIELARAEATP